MEERERVKQLLRKKNITSFDKLYVIFICKFLTRNETGLPNYITAIGNSPRPSAAFDVARETLEFDGGGGNEQ